LLAVENAPPGWHGRFGMVPQLGAPVGFIAANGLFLILGAILTPEQFQAWGWRLPFLGSILLVGVGLWIRLKLTETAAFKAASHEAPPAHVPVAELFKTHAREVIGGTFAVVACFALFYLTTAFSLGYGVTALGYGRQLFLSVLLVAILFMAAGIVWAGYWADASSPRRVLMVGSILTVVAGAILAPMMGSGSLWLIGVFLSLALVVMGLVYGPLGAWLPSLFPARVRYTGSSIAFNVGGVIGGGMTPAIAQFLAGHGGLKLVGLYLASAGAISLLALLPLKKTPDTLQE
jgi:MFS family permease